MQTHLSVWLQALGAAASELRAHGVEIHREDSVALFRADFGSREYDCRVFRQVAEKLADTLGVACAAVSHQKNGKHWVSVTHDVRAGRAA